jgi:uncharacterized coiled-coil protein SlyX
MQTNPPGRKGKYNMNQKLNLIRLILPLLVCLGLAPMAQAVGPDTDGNVPPGNNGEGVGVLVNLTTGIWNTGTGFEALNQDTAGQQNTATGLRALTNNISGGYNTGTGVYALFDNTFGFFNSATGAYSLAHNTEGDSNTANGYSALYFNTTGAVNTATGHAALYRNNIGVGNVANGFQALFNNTTGTFNTANGWNALHDNIAGIWNTANGAFALGDATSGSFNVAVGVEAGQNVTSGDNNVFLGRTSGDNTTTASNVVCIGSGADGENFSNRAYIPNIGLFDQPSGGGVEFVTVRLSDGKLGHSLSSRRGKEDIKPMNKASELIYKLKPVTFKYKPVDVDPNKGPEPQNLDYGLIAEDVAEIDPKLAIRDGKGEIKSLRYMAIYNMMLNEFLKEHQKVEAQQATIAELKSTVAQQQKGMDVLTAQLKVLAAQIQIVSTLLETSKPAPHVVLNTP